MKITEKVVKTVIFVKNGSQIRMSKTVIISKCCNFAKTGKIPYFINRQNCKTAAKPGCRATKPGNEINRVPEKSQLLGRPFSLMAHFWNSPLWHKTGKYGIYQFRKGGFLPGCLLTVLLINHCFVNKSRFTPFWAINYYTFIAPEDPPWSKSGEK